MSHPGLTAVRTGTSRIGVLALFAGLAATACDRSEPVELNRYGNPMAVEARPTDAEIDVEDLQTRLYAFSHDSMMGRQAGREGNMKGTAYIARELERLGIEPGGENGTYFQSLPYVMRRYTSSSTLTVDDQQLGWLNDFVAVPGNAPPAPINAAQVIFGGVQGDTANTISAEQASGKFVVMLPPPPGQRGGRGGFGGRGGRGRGNTAPDPLAGAAAVAVVNLDDLDMGDRAFINDAQGRLDNRPEGAPPPEPQPASLRLTTSAAQLLFDAPLASLEPGTPGKTVTAGLEFVERPVPEYGRNVIGIIRGSDPALAGQYVAIGAHNDHVGYNSNPVDHDSLRAFNSARLAMQMAGGDLEQVSPEQVESISINIDSLRQLRPARLDSIRNGADDDGSGSMAVLEIAEAIAMSTGKPRRSILFVWHTGEEGGLTGSRWFTDNPTVPRDSIIAQLNIDMIGRGRAEDIIGGGDNYLAIVGSKRLSVELGQAVVEVNDRQDVPLQLDYRFDEETTWPGYNNIYGRSDHWNYARHNIPIAFFFTGLHADYHQITDEPQYIDYPHYAKITNYIHDLTLEIANRENRPRVDQATTEGR
jgi:hypothetical protein